MPWLETCLPVDCCTRASYRLLNAPEQWQLHPEPPDTPVLRRLQRLMSDGDVKGPELRDDDAKERIKKMKKSFRFRKKWLCTHEDESESGKLLGVRARKNSFSVSTYEHLIPRAKLREESAKQWAPKVIYLAWRCVLTRGHQRQGLSHFNACYF